MRKKCNKCGEIKPLKDFYRHKACKNGVMAICKKCHNARTIASRGKHKVKLEKKACNHCGDTYMPKRAWQKYCCDACRKAFERDQKKKGCAAFHQGQNIGKR